MDDLIRISFTISWDLLKKFDRIALNKGYPNRSSAIRKILESFVLNEEHAKEEKKASTIKGNVLILLSNRPLKIESNPCFSVPVNDKYLSIILDCDDPNKMYQKIKKQCHIEKCKMIDLNTDLFSE